MGLVLALLTVVLTSIWVTELGFVFNGGTVATIVDPMFTPATLLVPGLLAVSVLARVVRHGVRLTLSLSLQFSQIDVWLTAASVTAGAGQ